MCHDDESLVPSEPIAHDDEVEEICIYSVTFRGKMTYLQLVTVGAILEGLGKQYSAHPDDWKVETRLVGTFPAKW